MKALITMGCMLMLWLSMPAMAHTPLIASDPSSGSVLSASPAQVTLVFAEPVRLTSLTAITPSGQKRLSFSPRGEAQTYTAADPKLKPGRNELRWKALSPDGHVVEGVIIVIVRGN